MNINTTTSFYLSKKTNLELKNICRAKHIANYSRCTKNELIFIIQRYYSYNIYDFVSTCYLRKNKCHVTILESSTCNICLQDDIKIVRICKCVFNICLHCISQLRDDICPHCKRRYNIAYPTDDDDCKECGLASVILEECNINTNISVFMGIHELLFKQIVDLPYIVIRYKYDHFCFEDTPLYDKIKYYFILRKKQHITHFDILQQLHAQGFNVDTDTCNHHFYEGISYINNDLLEFVINFGS